MPRLNKRKMNWSKFKTGVENTRVVKIGVFLTHTKILHIIGFSENTIQ